MRYLFIVLVTSLVMACSKKWTHAEYSPERFQTDNAACEAHEIKMSNEGSRRRANQIYTACMEGKGWTRSVMPR